MRERHKSSDGAVHASGRYELLPTAVDPAERPAERSEVELLSRRPWLKTLALLLLTICALIGLLATLGRVTHSGTSNGGERLEVVSALPNQSSGELPDGTLRGSLDAALPLCQRTLLYSFAGLHGFASEYMSFLRVAVLAQRFNYTLLVDDHAWNYGKMSDYFDLPALDCRLPRRWESIKRPRMSYNNATNDLTMPSWLVHNHVRYKRDFRYLDQLFLANYVEPADLASLHERDVLEFPRPAPLSAQATIEPAFVNALDELGRVAHIYWQPNVAVRAKMAALERREFWQSKRVLGAHIRLGDKSKESAGISPLHLFSKHSASYKAIAQRIALRPKPEAKLTAQVAAIYLEAASDILDSLRQPARYLRRLQRRQETSTTLLIMSDAATAVDDLRSFSTHPELNVQSTQGSPDESTQQEKPRSWIRVAIDRLLRRAQGFHESAWNRLPEDERVARTSEMISDITVITRRCNGFVAAGSSNVARLMTVLAIDKAKLGLVRSIDVRIFPTAIYQ
ncbi:uncharacterized protein L969DRAFT_101050 [Mixia osmundae IAM 14324]|uniref:Uncharacterized protein n=1 Tax=Mixia osmundae (strain CBS 9802 / IAM 14324 / JCM 22182 / KY 12970) TaxID=764103 RepID=G7DZD1_MIXOS|nr:uncharacterized protein L969DRAFT_101050 [Mixia osmundae IAM 14324]KEI42594.1 hypothetical protein L969DRAFT_101050 [Mixia osmundae IAM 14324]GAA95941.1 hypothetical protein E5Q_02599 [Mixia osmundae IAM 14324]